MLVVTISFYGAGINFGRAKVLKCLKCGKERMVFNVLPPQIDLEAGDEVHGDIVLQFVGKSSSRTGLHYWLIKNGLESFLRPSGYISWGLPFVLKDITVIPQEIAGMYRKKHTCFPITEFTTDYPYSFVLEIMAKSIRPLKPEDEVMCPGCFRELTESLQGNLRGRVLNFVEIRPRLINSQQPAVTCSKDKLEIFGHTVEIIQGSGNILLRLPEAVVIPNTSSKKVVVRITHPSHDPVEVELPDVNHYLYLYHPWPSYGRD